MHAAVMTLRISTVTDLRGKYFVLCLRNVEADRCSRCCRPLVFLPSAFSAPANAPQNPCSTGSLVSSDICEKTYTSSGVFTPDNTMSQLQVLLVAGGGQGFYAYGGGGGQVKLKDFSDASTPITLTVGAGGAYPNNLY